MITLSQFHSLILLAFTVKIQFTIVIHGPKNNVFSYRFWEYLLWIIWSMWCWKPMYLIVKAAIKKWQGNISYTIWQGFQPSSYRHGYSRRREWLSLHGPMAFFWWLTNYYLVWPKPFPTSTEGRGPLSQGSLRDSCIIILKIYVKQWKI